MSDEKEDVPAKVTLPADGYLWSRKVHTRKALPPHLEIEFEELRKRDATEHLEKTRQAYNTFVTAICKDYEGKSATADFVSRHALLAVIACVTKDLSALIEFAGNRRRELEERVTKLETRPALKWVGTYDPLKEYTTGNCVTHDGSVWHSNRFSRGSTPGTSPS